MTGMVEKVYSEAIFELGKERNKLNEIYEEISALSNIFSENNDLLKILSSPIINNNEKQNVLDRLFNGRISEDVYNFISIVTKKGRMGYICNIVEEFKNKCNEYNGIIEVTVTTVKPLKTEQENRLKEKLSKSTGKKIILITKIDDSIMGGIKLNYGNTEMDSSVKSRLDAVYKKMKSVIA